MIDPGIFCNLFISQDTLFFTGVPDSLLKNFCSWLTDHSAAVKNHIIAVNEGAAVALASGYHLATGKIPLVYMQNSGIGNAVSPLLSLADRDVYKIPMILLIGWRGEPGVPDEPQHLKQGKVTCDLFDAMDIPYLVLSENEHEVRKQIKECYAHINKNGTPFALIARKNTFLPYLAPYSEQASQSDKNAPSSCFLMSREKAIEIIMRSSNPGEIFISTTGMASRELYELREKYNMGHEQDFLTVGSMGHASSLALAVALHKPECQVNCLDGDGAALMHLGSMAAIGEQNLPNLRHFLLNNSAHDSVGGQPTIAGKIDLPGIARSAGYSRVFSIKTEEELKNLLGEESLYEKYGTAFIEVLVCKGNRSDLGRPNSSPIENKEEFMRFLSKEEKDERMDN